MTKIYKSNKLVYGVGIKGDVATWGNEKKLKSYTVWTNMLKRSYSPEYHERYPTYIGCSVAEDWLYFPNFKTWFDNNYIPGFHLDKDILFPGNKVYDPNKCRFVPPEINTLLIDRGRLRGDYPIGVGFNRLAGKFISQLRINGKLAYLGYFNCQLEAFHVYKAAKEIHVKTMATEYYNNGKIDEDIYNALWHFEVQCPIADALIKESQHN